jgi:hypothetical protein
MVSVWREDYIIVYLCNAGILHEIPFSPEIRFNKIFDRFLILKILCPSAVTPIAHG